ncbi:hypothetical protein NUW58_g1678 [Xylaria curta]|uniref:Uncharacterized protein n=1 Tax=Xylaria curta TaxID=42375 RepID=A0ACC1PLU9_9PEZI|nr:hypothetical protein NUW58_g1678 [Xylaria curta]
MPQAVYYGQEGWAYHGNGQQYWNHPAVGQQMNDVSMGSNLGQDSKQQYVQPTTQVYGQEGGQEYRIEHPNALPSPSTNTQFGNSDGWQHKNALMDPIISDAHPRQNLTVWKWRLMLIASNILSLINGYDASNVANIQGPIYEAFGDIHLLPWLALGYSVCNVITTPLARKLFKFYDIKVLTISGLFLVITGTAIAATSVNLLLLVVGRAVMAFGASIVYQGILTFSVIFSYPGEIALVHASIGASYAFGILTGPVIGAGFAQNAHATWRWSFYLCLPVLVIALVLCIFTLPHYSVATEKSVSTYFKEIDWVGHILHSGTFITFSLATVFSGSAWPWGSIPQLTIWVVFVVVTVSYIVQQTFSIGIKPERRIIPVHLLTKRTVLLTFLCTLGAAITYGVSFYYEPLFYAFTHDLEPLDAGLRLLCFTALFIVAILLAHALLPVARYYMPFFLLGGALLLAGGIAHHTVTDQTSLVAVMVFNAILGAGVGLLWNLAIPRSREVFLTWHAIVVKAGHAEMLVASEAPLFISVLGLRSNDENKRTTGRYANIFWDMPEMSSWMRLMASKGHRVWLAGGGLAALRSRICSPLRYWREGNGNNTIRLWIVVTALAADEELAWRRHSKPSVYYALTKDGDVVWSHTP